MSVDTQGRHHYWNDQRIWNFWVKFPDWEKNDLFAPVIHYFTDDEAQDGEVYERIIMPIKDWVMLIENEGINPKTDVPDPEKGFHFTKTSLIRRGGQFFDGSATDEEDSEEYKTWRESGGGEYSLSVGWYIVMTDDYIREDVDEYRALAKQGVVSNPSEYLEYLRKKGKINE